MSSVSALNMERVVRAREHHDSTCALGTATEVVMNPSDVSRSGWDPGDMIAGLTVVASDSQTLGYLHVQCPGDGADAEASENVEDFVRDRALISAPA